MLLRTISIALFLFLLHSPNSRLTRAPICVHVFHGLSFTRVINQVLKHTQYVYSNRANLTFPIFGLDQKKNNEDCVCVCANGADMKTTFYHVEVPISITFTIQIDFGQNCMRQMCVCVFVCVDGLLDIYCSANLHAPCYYGCSREGLGCKQTLFVSLSLSYPKFI